MIVRRTASSQLLITQPDHAALAGRIMRRWTAGGLRASPRHPEILLAIDQHDNGWQEADAVPIVEVASGRILDFVHAPDEVRRGVWPRGIDRLAGSPYAAALVAEHALRIYERYRTNPDWTAFFSGIEAARERYLRAVPGVSLETLQREYVYLRLGDLASLIFCNGWEDPLTESGWTLRLDGTRLVIAPDPFGGGTVPIEINALEVPDRPFFSSSQAKEAVAAAPRRVLAGVACGETTRGAIPNP
jgi:hypothetical protein